MRRTNGKRTYFETKQHGFYFVIVRNTRYIGNYLGSIWNILQEAQTHYADTTYISYCTVPFIVFWYICVRTVQSSVSVFRFVHLGKLRLSGPGAHVARTLLHTPATHRRPSNKNFLRTIPQNGEKLTQLGNGIFCMSKNNISS